MFIKFKCFKEGALRKDTILVSVMHANNEIGVIQDIQAIGELLAHQGINFHVDAAQSAGKVLINATDLNIDLLALSAHKNYGPKGVCAHYIFATNLEFVLSPSSLVVDKRMAYARNAAHPSNCGYGTRF